MDVRRVPLTVLHPDPRNARRHNARNLAAIQASLTVFGQQKPLVVTPTGMILAGNGTWEAARALNWTEIEVTYTTLGDDAGRAYSVADNRTAELAVWDEGELKAALAGLQAAGQPLIGWEPGEVQALGGASDPAALHDVEPQLDRAEALREQWGVEVGQLWQCGRHRVLCADCLDLTNIQRVLGETTPAMIFADPPYGVSIVATNVAVGGGEANHIPFGGVQSPRPRGHVGGGESYRSRHGEYAIQRDQRRGTDGAAKPFGSKPVRGTVGAAHVVDVGKYAPVLGDDSPATARKASALLLTVYPQAVHVWWGGNYYADALPPSSCWLVWDKETTGNFADCELAWTNQPKAARLFHHRWNGMLRDSERERRWHPTQKPAALAAWVYETVGAPGAVVLDPFLGCGPSLIAAEQRGRQVCGLELSPDYIAVTLQRYQDLTGQTPTQLE